MDKVRRSSWQFYRVGSQRLVGESERGREAYEDSGNLVQNVNCLLRGGVLVWFGHGW